MSESNTRAEIVKIMAEAYVRADLEGPCKSNPPEAYMQRVAPSLYPGMDAALTALESSGRAVVPRERNEAIEAARFLLARLSEFELCDDAEQMARDWMGHVEPAIGRLRAALPTRSE